MSDLIIPAAGAFLGSYFGPVGMQLGWMAGAWISGSGKQDGSSLQKLLPQAILTAQYNTPLPVVYGMQRVGGNIIWAKKAEPYTRGEAADTGKGGWGDSSQSSGTQQQGYYITMAIAICEGPIKGIRKVWANGKLIVDCTNKSKPLIGQLYTGTDTQSPDPTMVGVLGSGNVPAYRGIAYMVLNKFDNGASPAPPQFSFEVVKEL